MPELDAEHRDQLAEVLANHYGTVSDITLDALAPLVAGWLADARADALREAADELGHAHAPVAGYLRELADSYRGGDDG